MQKLEVSKIMYGITKFHSGKYALIDNHGESFTVYASEQKARFLFKNYMMLGFKGIRLIEVKHKTDFPKWGQILK